jgi:AcrR family transcriptional regulator
MPVQHRRERQRAERHRLILDTAREIAEADGWDAVTTRRLAEAIEYSQPVLYSHFAGRTEIVGAVALDGFAELVETLRHEVRAATDPVAALTALARGYLRFGAEHPATYAAMFTLDGGLRFAEERSPEPLRDAFALIADTLRAATDPADLETRTELLWSTLHGLVSLTAGHRLRPDQADARLTRLIAQLR